MKTLVDAGDYQSTLSDWCGAEAKVWMFHVTHNRMALHLYRKNRSESLYIIAVGCEHMNGPFHWHNADLTIATDHPDQYGYMRCRVMDKQAGFDLVCSDIAIAHGDVGVPPDPFDRFLTD